MKWRLTVGWGDGQTNKYVSRVRKWLVQGGK